MNNTSELEMFFNELHDFLKLKFNYKKNMGNASVLNHTISINRVRVSMYLRYKPSNLVNKKNMLVIARLEFNEERKGNGKEFLNFLCRVSKKYKIENIALEQTNLKSSLFAQRFGFKELMKDYWVVPTDELILNIT